MSQGGSAPRTTLQPYETLGSSSSFRISSHQSHPYLAAPSLGRGGGLSTDRIVDQLGHAQLPSSTKIRTPLCD
jgi:hypothetical protein